MFLRDGYCTCGEELTLKQIKSKQALCDKCFTKKVELEQQTRRGRSLADANRQLR